MYLIVDGITNPRLTSNINLECLQKTGFCIEAKVMQFISIRLIYLWS